jgi:hypothetical protein
VIVLKEEEKALSPTANAPLPVDTTCASIPADYKSAALHTGVYPTNYLWD